jgi:hypothetical protein
MKSVIVGVAFASLLVASAASAQALRPPSVDQWAPTAEGQAAFALREGTVDVTTEFPGWRTLRLGEFTLLKLQERVVRLRFTMTGVPPPAVPASAPRGQALATVGVDVIVLARR